MEMIVVDFYDRLIKWVNFLVLLFSCLLKGIFINMLSN